MTLRVRLATAIIICWGMSSYAEGPRPVRKGHKYSVRIDSAPQQAAVYLDDRSFGIVGYTPYAERLVEGDYKIIVVLPGYKPVERSVRIDKNARDFFVPLEKVILPGVIDIQAAADPHVAGAEVVVDGQPTGTAPLPIEVAPGRHLVELKKTGFQGVSQWVNLKEGERVTLNPALTAVVVAKPRGSLLIDADVPGAEVYVDGKLQPDTTPLVVDNLEEGSHIVEAKKPPAVPWKQMVSVRGGERTKVVATLAVTIQTAQAPVGGTVRVLANVEGAEVWLDGVLKGVAPMDLKDVSSGIHVVEARAKGYQPREDKVAVNAGSSTVVSLQLTQLAPAQPVGGRIKIVSPVPEAQVFIDGANVGSVPVERDLPAGDHFVTVQQSGYAKYEQKIVVDVGQTLTITAELRAIGTLRFLANIESAEVILDGEPIGSTPMVKEDVEAGDHVISIRKSGYHAFEQAVKVEGGRTAIINADLRTTGLSAEELKGMKRGLSSFGARTIPPGRFTVDFGSGYPYWVDLRATVGVKDNKEHGWDVAVGLRSHFLAWELLGTVRYRLLAREPFALAFFGTAGGGSGFDGRNSLTVQSGVVGSITFRNLVTVSGRAYLDFWGDKLCGPAAKGDGDGIPDNGPSVCTATPAAGEYARATELLGETVDEWEDLQDRFFGLRAYVSAVVEAAIWERLSLFGMIDGAAGQNERPSYTSLFNDTLFEYDPVYTVKVGMTAKF